MQWLKKAISRDKKETNKWVESEFNASSDLTSLLDTTSEFDDLTKEFDCSTEVDLSAELDKVWDGVSLQLEFYEDMSEQQIRWEKRLPRDVWFSIAKFISLKDLSNLFVTCRDLNFNRNRSVWRAKCLEVWRENVITPEFILMAKGWRGNPKEALRLSFLDGVRTKITKWELHNTTWFILHRPDLYNRLFKTPDKIEVKERSDLIRDFKYVRTRRRKLLEDGRVVAPGDNTNGAHSMRSWSWELQERENEGIIEQYFVYSSIHEFPSCRVIRLPNWGWAMKSSVALWLSFDPGEKPMLRERDLL